MRERKRHGGSLRGIPAKETRVPSFSFTAARRRVIPVSHVDFLKKKKKKEKRKRRTKIEFRAFRRFSRGANLTNDDSPIGTLLLTRVNCIFTEIPSGVVHAYS